MDVGNGTLLNSNAIASNPASTFGRVFFFDADFELRLRFPISSSVSRKLLFWKLHRNADASWHEDSDVRAIEVDSQFCTRPCNTLGSSLCSSSSARSRKSTKKSPWSSRKYFFMKRSDESRSYSFNNIWSNVSEASWYARSMLRDSLSGFNNTLAAWSSSVSLFVADSCFFAVLITVVVRGEEEATPAPSWQQWIALQYLPVACALCNELMWSVARDRSTPSVWPFGNMAAKSSLESCKLNNTCSSFSRHQFVHSIPCNLTADDVTEFWRNDLAVTSIMNSPYGSWILPRVSHEDNISA